MEQRKTPVASGGLETHAKSVISEHSCTTATQGQDTNAGNLSRSPIRPLCHETVAAFTEAMAKEGLTTKEAIIPDGRLHRFHVHGDKPRELAGWYVLHGDGLPAGAFGSWREGVKHDWCAKHSNELTPQDRAMLKARVEEARKARDADIAEQYAKARDKAQRLWQASQEALAGHPYLARKRIQAHGARILNGSLVVPLRDEQGAIVSLQFIKPDGQKRFLTGGRVQGCSFLIGDTPKDRLLIAEGFATAATLNEVSGYPVLVAFNAGNLEAVAEYAREVFPSVEIILAADNDPSGVGQDKASRAAQRIGAKIITPRTQGDFNDNLEEVMSRLNELAEQEPVPTIEPDPLLRPLPKGKPYPVEALGELRDVAEAIEGKTLAPLAIAAQSVLSAASLATQAHANVETMAGNSPASLNFLTIAQSGERKTTCDGDAMEGVDKFVAEKEKERKELEEIYNSEMAVWTAQLKKLENLLTNKKGSFSQIREHHKKKPKPPPIAQKVCTEPTFEGLFNLFENGDPSLGLYNAEGGQFLGGFSMATDNRTKTLAGFNLLWDGEPIHRTRKGDGAITLRGRRLAVHLMVQPKVAWEFLSDGKAHDTGFLARFLLACPESTIGTRMRSRYRPDSKGAIDAFAGRIYQILKTPAKLDEDIGGLILEALPLSEDAWGLLEDYCDHVEEEQREGGTYEEIRGAASKSAEQACRIAGVLTLYKDLKAQEVTAETMANAIKLAEWYLDEANRLAGQATISQGIPEAEKLREWLQSKWKEEKSELIQFRDIVRYAPNSLRDSVKAKAAIAILEEHGVLVSSKNEGRKTGKKWRIMGGNNAV